MGDNFAKPYKSIPEQIAILKSRELSFRHLNSAKTALSIYGYYRLINSYQKPFWTGTDLFENGTDFDDILGLYKFDDMFRSLVLRHCLRFETAIKTIISDNFASIYGAIGCWDEKNYNNKCKLFEDFFKAIKDLKAKAACPSKTDKFANPTLCHYMQNYGDIPIWVLMKSLTLGAVSMMFQCLKYNTQKKIAQNISKISHANFDVDEIISSLKLLTLLRNTCAHSDALFSFASLNTLSTKCDAYSKIYAAYSAATGSRLNTNNSGAAIIILSKMLPDMSVKRDFKKLSADFNGLLSSISPQAHLKLTACMRYDLITLTDIVTK